MFFTLPLLYTLLILASIGSRPPDTTTVGFFQTLSLDPIFSLWSTSIYTSLKSVDELIFNASNGYTFQWSTSIFESAVSTTSSSQGVYVPLAFPPALFGPCESSWFNGTLTEIPDLSAVLSPPEVFVPLAFPSMVSGTCEAVGYGNLPTGERDIAVGQLEKAFKLSYDDQATATMTDFLYTPAKFTVPLSFEALKDDPSTEVALTNEEVIRVVLSSIFLTIMVFAVCSSYAAKPRKIYNFGVKNTHRMIDMAITPIEMHELQLIYETLADIDSPVAEITEAVTELDTTSAVDITTSVSPASPQPDVAANFVKPASPVAIFSPQFEDFATTMVPLSFDYDDDTLTTAVVVLPLSSLYRQHDGSATGVHFPDVPFPDDHSSTSSSILPCDSSDESFSNTAFKVKLPAPRPIVRLPGTHLVTSTQDTNAPSAFEDFETRSAGDFMSPPAIRDYSDLFSPDPNGPRVKLPTRKVALPVASPSNPSAAPPIAADYDLFSPDPAGPRVVIPKRKVPVALTPTPSVSSVQPLPEAPSTCVIVEEPKVMVRLPTKPSTSSVSSEAKMGRAQVRLPKKNKSVSDDGQLASSHSKHMLTDLFVTEPPPAVVAGRRVYTSYAAALRAPAPRNLVSLQPGRQVTSVHPPLATPAPCPKLSVQVARDNKRLADRKAQKTAEIYGGAPAGRKHKGGQGQQIAEQAERARVRAEGMVYAFHAARPKHGPNGVELVGHLEHPVDARLRELDFVADPSVVRPHEIAMEDLMWLTAKTKRLRRKRKGC